MMATVHPASSSLLPLLESLEDSAAGQAEQIDAYLTIANRLSGEDGKHFLPAVVKHFSRLGKVLQNHIASPNVELSQAALQALGFCVFHSNVVSGIPDNYAEEILVALCTLVVKSTDKNTCTRALWVMSKQNFPSDVVARKVPDILKTLEAVRAREDIQSVVMEHEALNVVIRLLEQTPSQMGDGAVQWAKLVIPLVVHSASKVRLRAAAALEMGMPLLLQKQQEVAAIIEPLMSSKLIPELQKLFSSKNETNVLKLWPLFVRLLGKLLHRGGPFINSLLHLEELGFRSSSPIIKKIAFIAWKSLIDNFALNPDILCSAKRLKLLMQPLSSIQVRTEALLLTKLEVWWYLVVKLGPNLAANFEQVGVPLLQSAVSTDSTYQPLATPTRNSSQNTSLGPTTPKAGPQAFNGSASTPRMNLNSSVNVVLAFPSIQLLGLEMLLHYLLGSEVAAAAAKSKLQLSLEPLAHPLLSSPSSFSKHASVLISAVRDGFIAIGKDAPDALLALIWKSLMGFVSTTIETAGSKKDRPGSEVLALLLQALQQIVVSETLPAHRVLGLLEATVKGIPRKILGSAAYQVANMDVLNGTPALFLIPLFHHSSLLHSFVADERFFLCLEVLVGCGLSGPTSPLAFSESVLGVMSTSAEAVENKEHLWRMWSVVVNALTDTINQTNEVNQGDALEHNFTAVHSALMFPLTNLLVGHTLPQMTQKSLLSTWSRLYKAFARCSALVATAEENVCCEELCGKMAAALDSQALSNPSTLEAVASILLVIIECVDFSPYTPHFQQKTKSPHTPLSWVRKKNKPLGNLTTFHTLLVQTLESFLSLDASDKPAEGTGVAPGGLGTVVITVLSTLFSSLALGTAIQGALSSLVAPLALLYEQASRSQNEQPKFFASLGSKLEKLLGEMLGCLQTRSSLGFDDQLLTLLAPLLCVLFPHKSKQVRTLVTQFWNATFGNALILTYPDDLKPILSLVKQKTPIILPGFQAVDVPDDLSGQYSSECSQLETHVSGVKIASVGKRDSLLSRAGELKEKSSGIQTKPVSVKLDFGVTPKPPRRELLEEEASVDFVFIPPETKERVLTEHQKEVKRTKRVDIPAMYNNLDASLDTTVFSQYTQSQGDSGDGTPANVEATETPKNELQEEKTEEVQSKSADVSMTNDDGTVETGDNSTDDCNISASSDMVSGTPQKPSSRRQSFITLEKYEEGKTASPRVTKFTGPLTRATRSQSSTHSQLKDTASQDSSGAEDMEVSEELTQPVHDTDGNGSNDQEESPSLEEKLPEETKTEQANPEVQEVGKRDREDEDDIIPDTQIQVDCAKPQVEVDDEGVVKEPAPTRDEVILLELEGIPQDETSQSSQNSLSSSEIRRSGRRRSRPVRPGEDKEEVEERHRLRRKSSAEGELSLSQEATPLPASQIDSQSQGRSGRRSRVAAEELEGKDKLRKRGSADENEMSQADSQRASSTPVKPTDSQSHGRVTRSRSSGPAEEELSQTGSQVASSMSANRTDSQSQGRPGRRSKSAGSAEEKSQTDSQTALSPPGSQNDSQSQGRTSRRSKAANSTEEVVKTDSQVALSTPAKQTDSQSQGRPNRRSKVAAPTEEMSQTDTKIATSTPSSQTDSQPHGRPSRRSKAAGSTDEMSQISQTALSTPVSQTDSQTQDRQSRRSKVAGPTEEMSQTDSQTALSTLTDSQSQGRPGRRGKSAGSAEEMSQLDSQTALSTLTDRQSQGRPGRRGKSAGSAEEKSQTDSQKTLPTPASQTDSQYQDRPSRGGKMATELNVSSGSCPSPAKEMSNSQSADMGEGAQKFFPGQGRYKTRGSSQGLLSGVENSESDCSETHEDSLKPRKRDLKRKLLNSESTPSPLKIQQVQEDSVQKGETDTDPEVEDLGNSEVHQKAEPENAVGFETEAKDTELTHTEQNKETNHVTNITAPESPVKTVVETKAEVVESTAEVVDNITSEKTEQEGEKPCVEDPSKELGDISMTKQVAHRGPHFKGGRRRRRSKARNCKATVSDSLSQESDVTDSQVTEDLGESRTSQDPDELVSDAESVHPQPDDVPPQQKEDASINDDVFFEPNALSTPVVSDLAASPGEKEKENNATTEEMWETCVSEQSSKGDSVDMDEAQPESVDVAMEDSKEQSGEEAEPEDVEEGPMAQEEEPEPHEEGHEAQEQDVNKDEDFASVQEHIAAEAVDEEAKCDDTQIDNDAAVDTVDNTVAQTLPEEPPALQQTTVEPVCLDSPPKQKCLDVLAGELEVGHSPSSGKTRGIWSPSASPSTSILKKGQKRPLEVDSPSPLQKSRRVSFADPIHHQELADDIDRRSPVIRLSASGSPRSKNSSALSQQKFITTPTKGLLTLSPRNLRSPGYKSSKKCLISEMSQEPKPIPKDCVYPALVSCSTPVEAVLPQITSNMWPRGFGQLVRARNIRTVGDLSALTPDEIKSLPIRSPKLSNVKKALKNYHEQQRKGRNDELKGFDEMEKMTSEQDENEHQEEEKPPGDQVTDGEPSDVPAPPPAEGRSAELLAEVEALGARLTAEELGHCSPGQLVLMHEQLGGMMRTIVLQLQTRLAPSPGESIP
ncbi:telomere-associated protein RIF1 [Megalops cyprinoides]|uniref:telomere-associated protein RIF1 n=1 Tax=Megalops cyprinoides TaxID=118141 RepID=UPI001863C5C0|nr:telomere-associated protein RIF1 [Megalops cyprinoides]